MAERQLTFAKAINEAIAVSMNHDPKVYVMGLGVADPTGVFGTTSGLREKFGANRVYETPIAENAMTGVALGSCLVGMRPVMTHMRVEFATLAMDQICNQAAKWHYMFGGQTRIPMTIRMIVGRGWGQGPQHSQSLHAWFAHIPGLKVVMPTSPHDAKGLLISAIADDNPVVFIEHRWLYNISGPVPEGRYTVPIGEPRVVRNGAAATIVGISYGTVDAIKAAAVLAEEGIHCDVIDLRTLSPLNRQPIYDSVARTGRLIVVDPATVTAGFAAEIIASVTEKMFGALKASPIRIAFPDTPTPTTRTLSAFYYPAARSIVAAVRNAMGLSFEADPWSHIDPADKTLDVPDNRFSGPF